MNNDVDAKTESDSSSDSSDQSTTAMVVDANNGASIAPQDETKRRSLLDVVRNAVHRKNLSDTESSTVARDTESRRETNGIVDNDSNSENSSDENVPFHNHPRWKEMMREKAELTVRAKHYEEISDYMRANGLSNVELAQGFEVMALMKNDPFKAKEVLNQHMARLAEFTGDILPQDLQDKLSHGFVDEESAKELASYRARSAITSRVNQEVDAKNAQEAQLAHQKSLYDAVVTWEGSISSRDPEYRNKQSMVTDRVKSIMQESGMPTSPQQAVSYVERAYSEVNQRLGSLAGRNTPTRNPSSASNSSSSGSNAPQPRSLQEAVSWAARRGGISR